MNAPLVSVCLPNLNTFPYLQERVDTILGQSYPHWEMVVSDNYSEDGAWNFFQDLARQDPRVKIEQAPRNGLYANWNQCIRRAKGEYVYIATSDDTMAPDCLEKMVAALEEYDDCDLANCKLVKIDQDGALVTDEPDDTVLARSAPEMRSQRHFRRAPFDGMLHLTGLMVYRSITELLIRRSLFDRTGGFEPRWGSIGDLNWGMKAGLLANTVYVPETWASWRVHNRQATAAVDFQSAEHARKVDEMVEDAVQKCAPYLAPEILTGLRDHWIGLSATMRAYYRGLRNRENVIQRRSFQLGQLLSEEASRAEMVGLALGRPKWTDRVPDDIRNWLESVGYGAVLTREPLSLAKANV